MMVDPITLGVLGTVAGAALRWSDAGAEWLMLRGRTALVRAAAELPPGSQVGGTRRDGSRWLVQIPDVPRRGPDRRDVRR